MKYFQTDGQLKAKLQTRYPLRETSWARVQFSADDLMSSVENAEADDTILIELDRLKSKLNVSFFKSFKITNNKLGPD